jgi:two-component system, sensor histidine kinase PdtaS
MKPAKNFMSIPISFVKEKSVAIAKTLNFMYRGKILEILPVIRPYISGMTVILLILFSAQVTKSQILVKIDSLERALNKAKNLPASLDILNVLAAEIMDVNMPLAQLYCDSALDIGKNIDSAAGLAMAYHNKGRERWLNGYYYEAENNYQRSIKLHLMLNDSAALATNYSYLGLSYYYHSETDSALFYHFKAMLLNEALGKMSKVAHNLDNIALAYEKIGQFEKVIDYSSRALEIRTRLPGYSSRTNLYNYGGVIFNQKAFEEAVAYHKKVLNEEKSFGNNLTKIGRSINNIGSTFYSVGQYDSAVYYLRQSVVVIKQIGIPNWYAGQLNELGEALLGLGNLSEAEAIFRLSKQIWDSVGHRTSKAIVRNNLGLVYFKQKKYHNSLSYLDSAHTLFTSMHNNSFLVKSYYLKSLIYSELGDFQKAEINARLGLEISLKIKVKQNIMQGYELLARINQQLNNDKAALFYLDKYSHLKDSIYNGQSSLQLAQMQVVYETSQKNKEIELLNARSLNQSSVIRVRNLILTFTLSAVVSLAFVLFKRYRYTNRLNFQKVMIEDQNVELARRNHDKDILLGEIHHRVKNNLQLISSILNLQSRKLADMGAKDAIQEGRSRVKAMALIHQQLYKYDQYANINIGEYLETLVSTIADSFGYTKNEFEFNINIDEFQLDIDVAIKIGLITNELITNVFKHAFSRDKQNILKIKLRQEEGDKLVFVIADNGPGVSLDKLEGSNSFGVFLVKNLVEDMKGEFRIEQNGGTEINLVLYTAS